MKNISKTFQTEIISGITTFSSMAYIIMVHPLILNDMGLDFGSIMVVTIFITAFATLFMGLFANLPIAIAPGMGVSAFAVYSIAQSYTNSASLILTACFFAGFILLILNIFNIRQKILNSIPKPIFTCLIIGVGLFLIMVGLKQIGVVTPIPNGLLQIGSIHHLPFYLSIAGAFVILFLLKKGMKSAFLIVIFVNWIISLLLGLSTFHGIVSLPPSIMPTLFLIDFSYLGSIVFYKVLLAIFLVTLFDSSAGILLLGKLLFPSGKIPQIKKALTPDTIGSMFGACLGSTSLSIHLESASGIKVGGRTGLSSIVTALCFMLCFFFYPLVSSMPSFSSAPVLIAIGLMMSEEVKHINWKDFTDFIPGLITMILMPLTFSIYLGFATGFVSYCILKLITGKYREVPMYCWILSACFAFHLLFLN
ncbi:MAG: NCS2 family permease [Chlamydiales bacterium]|nr:NCS2 family permease [Chlamydiales bacterium]